jgi:hypothetical protein
MNLITYALLASECEAGNILKVLSMGAQGTDL